MKTHPEPKPLFIERMKELLGNDFDSYVEILKKKPVKSIRANKLKITPKELKKRLEKKSWVISQPFKDNPEIMVVEGKMGSLQSRSQNKKLINQKTPKDLSLTDSQLIPSASARDNLIELEPGELGRSLEHMLGYYYVQELASMLPVLALQPKPGEFVLDLCSAPGSKTTQMAAEMKNTGTIIANEISLKRIKILASNMEKCGVVNAIITKKEGSAFCNRMKNISKGGFDKGEHGFPLLFDKILVDAPCSGEGTLRSSPKTFKMWNIKTIKKLPKIQKNLVAAAIEILKPNGELVYSTCTHAPEENEGVVNSILEEFKDKIKIESISLPIKCRSGLGKWENQKYHKDVTKSCRIYPQDNNTEGFFIAKFRRIK